MNVNNLLLIAIAILLGVLTIVIIYLIASSLTKKKTGKHIDELFDPDRLVEEDSLMNSLDEKKNVDFQNKTDEAKFLTSQEKVEIVRTDEAKEKKLDPFNINGNQNNDNKQKSTQENNNRFFN